MLRLSFVVLLLSLLTGATPAHGDRSRVDRWIELPPPARAEHIAVFDARHDRFIVFGGQVEGAVQNDVWVLYRRPFERWVRLDPSGEWPAPRVAATAVFDPAKDRLLVYGGCDSADRPLDELWELSLRYGPRWRRVPMSATRPRARCRATLTLEPGGNSAILYGGAYSSFIYSGKLDDAWRLSLERAEWTKLAPTGTIPAGRDAHTAIFSPELGGVLVFGGNKWGTLPGCPYCQSPRETDELWLLDLSGSPTWRQLQPTTSDRPCPVQGHVAFRDSADHRMLMCFGGTFLSNSCERVNTTLWSLDLRTLAWSRLSPAGTPRTRYFPAAHFDPLSRRLYLHGGMSQVFDGTVHSDTWALSLDDSAAWWRLPRDSYDPPLDLISTPAPMVYDPRRDRIIVDSGTDLWTCQPDAGEWSPLPVRGESPPAHYDGVAVLDSRRDRILVYGGSSAPHRPSQPMQEVWALDPGRTPTWSKLEVPGARPPAGEDAAFYDPIRDRLIVWIRQRPGSRLGGLWSLGLGETEPHAWEHVPAEYDSLSLGIDWLSYPVLVYDSKRDEAVLFGGGHYDDGWNALNEASAFPLAGEPLWRSVSPYGPRRTVPPLRPTERMWATGVYEPSGDRLLVFGGFSGSFVVHLEDDAVAFDLEDQTWSPLQMPDDPHPGWTEASSVYDSRRDRTLVFQGDVMWAFEAGEQRGHRWRPRVGRCDVDGLDAPMALELLGSRPNPASGDATIDLVLPDAMPATLELLDLAGRRIWSRDVGALGIGRHSVPIVGARGFAPGVYFVRLSHGSEIRTAKLVRVRP
jgi:hypothetical protein